MAINRAKIITLTSVRGGTGKTITTLNLAGIFESMKKKVLIIDLDLYAGSIDLLLKLKVEQDLFNLIDDLNNNRFETMDNYITKYDDYIDVIASPKDPRNSSRINSRYLNILLGKTKMQYDVILIDTNYFMNDINLVVFDSSDTILYVINNDLVDLKNMRTMVSIYTDMDKNNYKIILNESANKKSYFTKYDINHMIYHNVDYTIPSSFYIKNIEKYLIDGKILTLDNKIKMTHKKAIENLEKIVRSIYKEPVIDEDTKITVNKDELKKKFKKKKEK